MTEVEAQTSPPGVDRSIPLCVDLDGTLIATNLLWESLCAMARRRPMSLARLPLWWLRGRAHLKEKVLRRARLDATSLPYRAEVVSFVAAQKRSGRRVLLTTSANERHARWVVDHLGLFDEVVAGDRRSNLDGPLKHEALERRFGSSGYDYVGDSLSDLSVWRSARRSYVVSTNPKVVRKAKTLCNAEEIGVSTGRPLAGMIKALRTHQWAKNLLLFVPLVTSLQLFHGALAFRAGVGVVAFSLIASAVYVLNDLMDLQADRLHPRKKHRPFAAGHVLITTGFLMAMALMTAGLALGLLLSPWFAAMLGLYLLLTTAYTVYLKRKLLADVTCLAALYTFRIQAGGVAAAITISNWLMAFSMFLFLSLAFAKRYTELVQMRGKAATLPGRGYRIEDLSLVQSIGSTCGLLCVLVLCLYVSSPEVARLYRHPDRLWLACPLLLCWVARVWFLAVRGELDDDPVLFALKDRISYVIGAGVGGVVLAAV